MRVYLCLCMIIFGIFPHNHLQIWSYFFSSFLVFHFHVNSLKKKKFKYDRTEWRKEGEREKSGCIVWAAVVAAQLKPFAPFSFASFSRPESPWIARFVIIDIKSFIHIIRFIGNMKMISGEHNRHQNFKYNNSNTVVSWLRRCEEHQINHDLHWN